MADSLQHDEAVIHQSGGRTPTDVPEPNTQQLPNSGDERDSTANKENTNHISNTGNDDQQALEDGTTRSDTSRADGSNADGKSTDARPVKKLVAAKPVSFAKYSVPKTAAGNAGKAAVEKVAAPNTANVQAQPAGRPRLVAKTTSSLGQKIKPFRSAAPDPMQVWNKNRVVPQPSTKNLTDEELKQQYGIHLTSRLKSDGDSSKEKWADIDDEDDDWAPDTIEWGDGTKSSVPAADAVPGPKSAAASADATPAIEPAKPVSENTPAATTFTTTIGPNATVLKVGARAEIQQAQKASGQAKGPQERLPLPSSRTTPAPVPVKSPWAKLPPVDTLPPVEITPHAPPTTSYFQSGDARFSQDVSRPAREISADDFQRSPRDPAQTQLYMPNSGRYEAVPDNRRRLSRHESNFRAPAVLQRPSQSDARAPEPSAAFQTSRNSSDAARRRPSSIHSGGSGSLARRMSLISGDGMSAAPNGTAVEVTEPQQASPAVPAAHVNGSTYQARGGEPVVHPGQSDAEIEAQRQQQRQLMREQAETARKRRLEEEARQEAEKKERIRQKLLSLGPDPKLQKAEEAAKEKVDRSSALIELHKDEHEPPLKKKSPPAEPAVKSPPKPPQPTATGEPQQYGMMKVHPMDSVKKASAHLHQPSARATPNATSVPSAIEDISPEPPAMNGLHDSAEPVLEPIPRNARPVSSASEARTGWGRGDLRPAGNLWGAPHNKALGNGTFDQTLAGYAPQDLSSRASSTGQGWMNGKTPTVGQSPQLTHITQHVPETRSQTLQNMTSPEALPLAMNSEVDSMLPVRPPAPIGPPQVLGAHPALAHSHMANGHGPGHANSAIAGWNNFPQVARAQDRAEFEQHQREQAIRREEEKRGIRQQANYNFEETFKQVQIGQQPDQRHITNVSQTTSAPPSNMFGAVGSLPSPALGPQTSRNSRFFNKQQTHLNGTSTPQPRHSVHAEVEIPRSPSPPPAEELFSAHPAYERTSYSPIIRFPRAKAVVKLPPAKPATPPAAKSALASPVATAPNASAKVPPAMTEKSPAPLTWAARVSMAAKPATPVRGAAQPIVQDASWQDRINGLFGKSSDNRRVSDIVQVTSHSVPSPASTRFAITAASKEPLDIMPGKNAAAVSLPFSTTTVTPVSQQLSTKRIEDEEDLFEDREAGSLPILFFPSDARAISWPLPVSMYSCKQPAAPEVQSAFTYLSAPWRDDRNPKQYSVIVRAPGSEKSIKKDLPVKAGEVQNSHHRTHTHHRGHARRGHRAVRPPRSAPDKSN